MNCDGQKMNWLTSNSCWKKKRGGRILREYGTLQYLWQQREQGKTGKPSQGPRTGGWSNALWSAQHWHHIRAWTALQGTKGMVSHSTIPFPPHIPVVGPCSPLTGRAEYAIGRSKHSQVDNNRLLRDFWHTWLSPQASLLCCVLVFPSTVSCAHKSQ